MFVGESSARKLTPDASSTAWGSEAGGSIEVYADAEWARKRAVYLSAFQGTILDPGALKQVGNVVVRASDKLKKSQQDKVIAFLEKDVQ